MRRIELPAGDFPYRKPDKQAQTDLGNAGDTGVGAEH
jgi:hypothetical protein